MSRMKTSQAPLHYGKCCLVRCLYLNKAKTEKINSHNCELFTHRPCRPTAKSHHLWVPSWLGGWALKDKAHREVRQKSSLCRMAQNHQVASPIAAQRWCDVVGLEISDGVLNWRCRGTKWRDNAMTVQPFYYKKQRSITESALQYYHCDKPRLGLKNACE